MFKKFLTGLAALLAVGVSDVRAAGNTGNLQNVDFATPAQILSAGGALDQLLNDTNIWLTGPMEQLSTYIQNQVTSSTTISIGLTLPASVFSVIGSPVTAVGTLQGIFNTQPPYTFLSTGVGGGVPIFQTIPVAALPNIASAQNYYVSSVGSDTPTCGGTLSPCATVAYAESLINTTASAVLPYAINVLGGTQTIDGVDLYPYIYIVGNGYGTTLIDFGTAGPTFDVSWATGNTVGGIFAANLISSTTGTGIIDFTSSGSSNSIFYINAAYFGFTTAFDVNGPLGNVVSISNSTGNILGHPPNLLIQNGGALILAGSQDAFNNITADATTSGAFLYMLASPTFGNVALLNATANRAILFCQNSGIVGTFQLDGTQALADITSDCLPATSQLSFTSGALPTQIGHFNDAFGEGYIPAVSGNWPTPNPTNVRDALDDLAQTVTANASIAYLPLTGGTLSGGITMSANSITELANPINPQDAATMAYVDSRTFPNNTLSTGAIYIGNSLNMPVSEVMYGAGTLDMSGLLTLSSTGVTPGSYTNANITVGLDGRISLASDGSGGGGGGGVASSNLEALEQKLENEHYAVGPTDPLDNSVGTGFGQNPADYNVFGILLEDYTTPSTTISVVWSPTVLNPSDNNTTTDTNWNLYTASGSGNLTTSLNNMVGGASVSFDKTSIAFTSAAIYYDFGASNLGSVYNQSLLYFWINLPSLANLTNVEERVDIDGANMAVFQQTTNCDGGPLVVGWNLICQDLSQAPISSLGTGWLYGAGFRYFHVGVNTSLITQLYSGILVNGIFFGSSNTPSYVQLGNEFSIYDNSTSESMQIDAASTEVSGDDVTLTATLANSYGGGFGATSALIYRNTLQFANYQAAMTLVDQGSNTLAGAAQLTQTARISRNLRSSLAAKTLAASVDVGTPQVYQVVSVSPGSVLISDTANTASDLLSGESMLDFQTLADNGTNFYSFRNAASLNANSTWAGGITTLNFAVNPVGVVAGDYIAKDHVTASYTGTTVNGNENFAGLSAVASPDNILLYQGGYNLPYQENTLGVFSLSGSTGAINSAVPPQANLAQVGALSSVPFLNGFSSLTGWSSANYLSISHGQALGYDNQAQLVAAIWVYPTTNSITAFVDGMTNGPGTTNWWIGYENASGTQFFGYCGGTAVVQSGSVTLNAWHHVVFQYTSGATNGEQLYVDGNLVGTGTCAINPDANNDPFSVGYSPARGGGLYVTDRAAQVIVQHGVNWTPAQVRSLYNGGSPQTISNGPLLKYRYSQTPVSGQHIGMKVGLKRDTTNVAPYVRKFGIIDIN